MSDRIAIRGIRAFGRHGALPGERERLQPFDIEVELEFDATAARGSDALIDTIDYAAIHARVVRIVRELSFQLLERLGEEILTDIMTEQRVASATVTIGKPGILDGATPEVRLTAARGTG